MKKTIYRADSRGFSNHGWLKTYHLFSFANYYNESRMNFGKLRVFNHETVEPGGRFGPHTHDNIEMIFIPIQGKIAHKDLEGNEHISSKGEVQVISTGKGLTHSEYNPSEKSVLNFLQIWIYPNKLDTKPSYRNRKFEFSEDSLVLLISPDGFQGSLTIRQRAHIYYGKLSPVITQLYRRNSGKNGIFIYTITGIAEILSEQLNPGDSILLEDIDTLELNCNKDSEILLIDIPME